MTTLFYFFLTLLLVLLNAFFVASEFAIVKIRPTRLEQLVRGGALAGVPHVEVTKDQRAADLGSRGRGAWTVALGIRNG